MNHLPFHKADIIPLSALTGYFAGVLPTLALLLPVLWYSYQLITAIWDRFFRKR